MIISIVVTLLGLEEQEALMKSLMDFGAIEISSIDAEEVEEIVISRPSETYRLLRRVGKNPNRT